MPTTVSRSDQHVGEQVARHLRSAGDQDLVALRDDAARGQQPVLDLAHQALVVPIDMVL